MIASRNCEHKSIQQVVTENSAIILDIVVFLLHSIIMKYIMKPFHIIMLNK